LSTDNVLIDIDLTGTLTLQERIDIKNAWSLYLYAETDTDELTLYFEEAPDVDIPIKLQVIR
jgi:hypothetical protein